MSFFEPSARIPLLIHAPGLIKPRRISEPVSQVDILPTLTHIAQTYGNQTIPEPVDSLDGQSLLPLCQAENQDKRQVIGEYLAEGTGQPILMLREGLYKYICCPGDPEQLFELKTDPDELNNRAQNPSLNTILMTFRAHAEAHWDAPTIREQVLADQARRRFIGATLRQGHYTAWDYQPHRDASEEYSRSHMELTALDSDSRFPRPEPFKPRWR
jgi:choline-sulfatase